MRTHFQRPARAPWIAGIAIGLFAAIGIAAIARSISVSYADIPHANTPAARDAASGVAEGAGAGTAQAQLEAARIAASGRNRARCPECGVVESIRQIARSGDTGGHAAGAGRIARGASGGRSGSAMAANGGTGNGYEITVRLRDGSKTVFNESSPRSWQPGSRVLVISRADAARN